jgi:hypothetical protein
MVIKTLESGTGMQLFKKNYILSLLNMSAGCWRSSEEPQSTEEAEESAYMRTCEKKLIDQLDPLVYYGISPCEQSSGN